MEELNNETPRKNKITHCAIYTRKSTEEGLEQEFNSLDAQRESAEAYITSQKSQGWICLPDHYDDGGFSGGNMDRPALQHLLVDIERGFIDCVVVYKVDRLSRSLMDFAKILERFEIKSVAFVSVTQQMSTRTSMGRLTLNILLSFAQFERELVSERTRDKIVMARKKGKYTGGRPVLGYDLSPEAGKLMVNHMEAQRVRTIFDLYLRLDGVLPVVDELRRFGWTTKSWVTRKGNVCEGHQFNKNSIYSLLSNPLYIGKVKYKDELYAGEHAGIIPETIFAETQTKLAENRRNPKSHKLGRFGGILNGILRCKACGCGMSHSYSKKADGRRYRYYVCNNATKTGWKNCPHPSLPAAEIETFILNEIRTIGFDETLIEDVVKRSEQSILYETQTHKKQLQLLQKELATYNDQLLAMMAVPKPDSVAITKMREQVAMTERSIADVEKRLETLKHSSFSMKDVRSACRKFDPIWDTLSSKEQRRMLKTLLESVEFDAATESVILNFAPGGVKKLIQKSTTSTKPNNNETTIQSIQEVVA
jgi:site-specific DNA recombinase